IAGMLRIDVSVMHAGAVTARDKTPSALAMASGFIGTAVLRGFGNVPDWSPYTYQQTATPEGAATPGSTPGTNPPATPGTTPPAQGAPGTQ
ncbi:MAG: hypothetical protein ABI859_19230, partial [Pseudomonadota bacterium]